MMGGFTLRLWFSGICQFVENRAVNEEGSRLQLCILLPDAREAEVQHEATISIPRRENRRDGTFRMLFDEGEKAKPLVTFERASRVEFEFTHVEGHPKDPVFQGDDSLTIHLADLIGPYADAGLDVVSPKPSAGILAQIVLDRGFCRDGGAGTVRGTWYLPDPITGQGESHKPVEVTEPKVVEIHGLLKVVMIVRDLEDPAQGPPPFEFKGDNDEYLDILVSNRCKKPTLALQKRPSPDGQSFQLVQLDADFVEHYKALHPISLESLRLHRAVLENRWPNGLPYLVPERVALEVFLSDELFEDPQKQLALLQFWVELKEGKPVIVFQGDDGKRTEPQSLSDLGWAEAEGGDLAWLMTVRDFLVKAVSSGSGCDCLPCKGTSRFLDFAPPKSSGSLSLSAPQAQPARAVLESQTGKRIVGRSAESALAPREALKTALEAAVEDTGSVTGRLAAPRSQELGSSRSPFVLRRG